MSKVYIDIEISFENREFVKFAELADELDMTVPETIEKCMYEKRDEYLEAFKVNLPKQEDCSTVG